MAHRLRASQTKKIDSALLWASVTLTLLGAADAIYLLIYKLSGDNRLCLGSGGCHDVNFSRYSEIFDIPVSLIGLLGYLAILAILLAERRMKIASEHGPLAIFGMAVVGVAYSAYLTYVELHVIQAVCPFCVASAVIFLLIFILAIIRLVKQTAS
jgi:uncharacterized membrane protein